MQVTLNVEAPPGPQLQISPPQFNINAVQGAPATHLQLAVLNAGGGTLNFSAQLRFLSGTNWASLDSNSGAATFAAPGSVGITINSAPLNPGIYQAEAVIIDQGSNQSQTCSIILSVTARSLSIQLSQAGLQFTAAAGGAASPAQTFGIANVGQGEMNWSAAAQTLSGPDGWLVATPAAGRLDCRGRDRANRDGLDQSGATLRRPVFRVGAYLSARRREFSASCLRGAQCSRSCPGSRP